MLYMKQKEPKQTQ